MMCDSSQSGTVMECPTCFQKITAPQAPASDDTKFIITGTKKGERPTPKFTGAEPGFVPAPKGFPGALVVLIIFIFIGAAVAFVYRGTIFKSKSAAVAGDTAEGTNQPPAKARTPSRSALIAPHASDANWMLNLGGMANFPDEPAAGRIHGQDFIAERTMLQNGTLTLRTGRNGAVTFGVEINFGGAQPEALAGRSLNIVTNAPTAARVTLPWEDGGQAGMEDIEGGYALRLQFGQLAGNRLPGKIYFCAPDESKSYVAGTFNAQIRRLRKAN
jgi:hypothetical protein